jgi:HPt (histidine-containing phosphotransfer) domain-containing protein
MTAEFETRMAELGAKFRVRAVGERELITAALVVPDLSTIKEASHRLAGIAAIFGHSRVGHAAEQLEAALEREAPLLEIRRLCGVLVEGLDEIS